MADFPTAPGLGRPETGSISLDSLVAVLQANGRQMSALLMALNTAVTGLNSAHVVSPPANSGSTGVAGQIAYDASFFYICVAANTWRRVAIAAF